MSVPYRLIFFVLSAIHVVHRADGLQLDKNTREAWCNSLEGWNNVIYGNFCYTVHQKSLTWSDAVSDCKAKDGQLFKPLQFELIGLLTKRGGPPKAWAGAQERDGKFYWLDGTSFVLEQWYSTKGFFNEMKAWITQGPLCTTLQLEPTTGLFFNLPLEKQRCSKEYPYICEHDLNNALKRTAIPVDVPTEIMEITTSFSEERATTAAPDIRTLPPTPTTASPEAKPKSQPNQYTYKGIKHINRVFNPKLRAKPDRLLMDTDTTNCARICSQDKCCKLLNHFPPETCALYCDEKRARAKGAKSFLGSRLWEVNQS